MSVKGRSALTWIVHALENCFPDFRITFLAIKLCVADRSATGAYSGLLKTVVHLIKIDAGYRLVTIEQSLLLNGGLQLCIRSKNTSIELALRRALWSKGYRYVTHYKGAPGKPDIAFKSIRLAIFCDSAFWHGKELEKTLSRIKTHKEYWAQKIERNVERDREVNDALLREGWDVLRFWDVDIKNSMEITIETIESHVEMRRRSIHKPQPKQSQVSL